MVFTRKQGKEVKQVNGGGGGHGGVICGRNISLPMPYAMTWVGLTELSTPRTWALWAHVAIVASVLQEAFDDAM
ncbi:hypothetical protein TWF718_007771 [Orbilia javanica]|uniref:Uncharacterized protein n=1 Tax=Orbilia javanica TaxID=47235 RepID=A0AAN8RGQ2_9PEZI